MFGKTKVRKSWGLWLRPAGLMLCFCLLSASVVAQKAGGIQVRWAGLGRIGFTPSVLADDSLMAEKLVRETIEELRSMGYLGTSLTSLQRSDSLWSIALAPGASYKWAKIYVKEEDKAWLQKVGFRGEDWAKGKAPGPISQGLRRVQNLLIEEGYPFTALYLDSLGVQQGQLEAFLRIDTGLKVLFDTLELQGVKVKPSFLATWLGLKPGSPFQESALRRVENRLRRLPFLQLEEPPVLRFRGDKAYPSLLLQERKVNEADGVLGLLPNELEPGKVLLTGRLALDIHNLFASGKRFRFAWQQMRPETQSLDMAYEHPVFLGTPLDVQASLSMLREADNFLNIRFEGSLRYLLGAKARMALLTGNHRGTVPGTTLNPELPGRPVDMRYTFYGLQADLDTRDDPFHPFRGLFLEGRVRIGNRRVLDQDLLSGEGEDWNSIKLEWDFRAESYFPLRPRLILQSVLQGGQVRNRQLFTNELLRVGGLQRLRGFNENFFFASSFGLLSVEPRYYLDPSSYLFLFFDQSVLQLPGQDATFVEWPFGAGAGLSFTTEAGVFNLAFALGRSSAQPFDVEYAKVHIGYISRF